MDSVLKYIGGQARKVEYMLKGKDPVQKVVLEASRGDSDEITEVEYMNVARLSFDDVCLHSIQKTLWKRFARIMTEPVSCKKGLLILDYCLRFGSDQVRNMVLRGQSELTNVTMTNPPTYRMKPEEASAIRNSRDIAQRIMDLAADNKRYTELRKIGESTIERAKRHYIDPTVISNEQLQEMRAQMYAGRASQTSMGTDAYTTDYRFSHNSPSYDSPSYNSPSYNSPSYNSPSYEEPAATTPAEDSDEELPDDFNHGRRMSTEQQFNVFAQRAPAQPAPQSSQVYDPFASSQPAQPKPTPAPATYDPFAAPKPAQQAPQQQNFDMFAPKPAQQARPSSDDLLSLMDVPSTPQQRPMQQPYMGAPMQQPMQQYPNQMGMQQPYGMQQGFMPQQQRPMPQQQYMGAPMQQPMQQYPNQMNMQARPAPQQRPTGRGMLDEFGSLAEIDLRGQRAVGRPQETRGGGQSLAQQGPNPFL